MADGVPITPGEGATVATDDAGEAGQVQIVKLALSADGSATPIGADANGLDVDVARTVGTAADGGALPAGTAKIGDVGVGTRTSGGLSIFRSLDLDETEEEVKATAGQLYGYFISNKATSARFVKFYNATAANVTVGSTTPLITLEIPKEGAANVMSDIGIAFGTAITVAATTGVADADTGAPAANDIVVNLFYA